jgi:hypothetical protein
VTSWPGFSLLQSARFPTSFPLFLFPKHDFIPTFYSLFLLSAVDHDLLTASGGSPDGTGSYFGLTALTCVLLVPCDWTFSFTLLATLYVLKLKRETRVSNFWYQTTRVLIYWNFWLGKLGCCPLCFYFPNTGTYWLFLLATLSDLLMLCTVIVLA